MEKMLKVYQWMFQLLLSRGAENSWWLTVELTFTRVSPPGSSWWSWQSSRSWSASPLTSLTEVIKSSDSCLLLHFSVQRNRRYFGSFESLSGVHFTTGPEFGVASTKVLCLIMFALVMCEDRISLQPVKSEIIQGFTQLPDQDQECAWVGSQAEMPLAVEWAAQLVQGLCHHLHLGWVHQWPQQIWEGLWLESAPHRSGS